MDKPVTIELPDGKEYRATVLQVVESDEKGPRVFRILRPDESTTVQQGMQFWVVYASADVLDQRVH